jgi:hypothetical protein
MEVVCDLMDDYEGLTTTSIVANTNIQSMFKECVGKIMQFIEWRDCMEPDNDTLFSEEFMSTKDCRSTKGEEEDMDTPLPYEPIEVTNSFWGKSITKSGHDRRRRLTYKPS